jgi:hypothetical protein
MDRLMEANKVASLMRRRENLKPITLVQPESASVLDSRSFPAAQISTARNAVIDFKPVPAALAVPSVIHSEPVCIMLHGDSVAGEPAPRLMGTNGTRMRPRSLAVPKIARRVKSRVAVQQAQMAMLRQGVAPQEIGRRLFDTLPISRRKPAFGHSLLQRRPAIAPPFVQACTVRTLDVSAILGRDVWKSQSKGFRPPQLRRRPVVVLPNRRSALDWNDDPRTLELAREFPAPQPPLASQRMPVRDPRFPAAPQPCGRGGREWPVTRPPIIEASAMLDIPPMALRVSGVRWSSTPLEASLRCDWYRSSPSMSSGYSKDKDKDKDKEKEKDSPRGSGAAAEKSKTPVAAELRMEEHFENGCGNWVGDVADWKLDAAGARTGSLALFGPSIEMIDYDLEFLVRVEKTTVTWVFRAAELSDYYRLALRINPKGGYLFERTAVIAGVPEPVVSKPVTVSSNARTALAVRTSVKGKDFAVFLEGQAVDQWSDDRLPMGGVGFGSAPDDRARLYWMRLTYSGSPGLKDGKR